MTGRGEGAGGVVQGGASSAAAVTCKGFQIGCVLQCWTTARSRHERFTPAFLYEHHNTHPSFPVDSIYIILVSFEPLQVSQSKVNHSATVVSLFRNDSISSPPSTPTSCSHDPAGPLPTTSRAHADSDTTTTTTFTNSTINNNNNNLNRRSSPSC